MGIRDTAYFINSIVKILQQWKKVTLTKYSYGYKEGAMVIF